MSIRPLFGIGIAALATAALATAYGTATAGPSGTCTFVGKNGYAYAGHQAGAPGHGVRATITVTRAEVTAGHVASWVGVGGPGQGATGGNAWIQVGVATVQDMGTMLYAEITREGNAPRFVQLASGVPYGRGHRVAVLEMAGRPGWWRVWMDGKPATGPIHIRGSSGRWSPVATAESWNGGQAACNRFSYRFEGVSVARAKGGAWRPFVPRFRFLQSGYRLRHLTSSPGAARSLSSRTPVLPYAFVAASGS